MNGSRENESSGPAGSPKGVRRYAANAGPAHPQVAIVSGIHGNERGGVDATGRLEQRLQQGSLTLQRGTLILVDGNLAALASGVRHTRTGADLNRVWDFEFESRLMPAVWGYEHHRALELRSTLGSVDALLDLHSASTATPAFAICNGAPRAEEIAGRLHTPFVVRSWDSLAEKVLIGFLAKRSIPAVVVECGQHQEPGISNIAEQVALRFLESQGLVEIDPAPVAEPPTTVRVVETITRPSQDFTFERAWRGFDKLPAGTLLGQDQLTELRIHRECRIVLPHPDARVGEDMTYLALEDH